MGLLRQGVKRLFDGFLWRRTLPSGAGDRILLTFDDGPDPRITPRVLDLLDDYGARALFFLVGRLAEAEPALTREILLRGHAVGNHTQNHPRRTPAFAAYLREVADCQRTLAAITGVRPAHFRPMRGLVTPGSAVAGLRMGARQTLWAIEAHEWSPQRAETPEEAGRRLGRDTEPGDIVLLHDNHPDVAATLAVALPLLAGRGLDLGSGLALLCPEGGRRAGR